MPSSTIIRCYTTMGASLAFVSCSQAFAPIGIIKSTRNNQLYTSSSYSTLLTASIIDDIPDGVEWIPLVDTPDDTDEMPPVVIHTLTEGDEGTIPTKGATVELQYTGTLLSNDWTSTDAVECWLSNLQGLDHLSSVFIENQIDSTILMDETIFNEDYCTNELGMSNKIQIKKLIMAARRLVKQKEDYPRGMEFDSSISRNKNYTFTLGAGKAIQAIELAVSKMKVHERAIVICRSDYGYGRDGLRTSKGDVIVPPFATLCFDLTLVSATS